MKHHRDKLDFPFVHQPVEFDKFTEKELLQFCLGGTLYMPGTRHILDKILHSRMNDLTSMVMCFEDAIAAEDLPRAEANVLEHLDTLSGAIEKEQIQHGEIPLIFLRVRNTDQFMQFSSRLSPEQANVLTGFVFPKFYTSNAPIYLDRLAALNEKLGVLLYGMPILEGKAIAYRESRDRELQLLREILEPFKRWILNVRVGGTDFSSIFGVRRNMNSSIYDIVAVRDCLADILNYFNRAIDGYVVSGPVWEYFLASNTDDIDEVASENIHNSLLNRQPIINAAIDGLLREVLLDKANGFIGKTIIHPSHLKYVNAMQAVTREEYEDAQQILRTNGGVIKSTRANKMNEINPHRSWAQRLVGCGAAFGVIEDDTHYIRLCQA